MTNKIMSIAAIAAIFGTSAYAFDTNTAGKILNRDAVEGNYTGGTASTVRLLKSVDGHPDPITGAITDRLKGDALIFPAFQADEDGWNTEIVLRNNYSNKAIIAKVVVYDGKDSSEVRDFNVYLSANDQLRINLSKDGVYSEDGSIVIKEPIYNADGTPSNDPTRVKFASAATPFNQPLLDIARQEPVKSGYVVVYGVAETNGSAMGYDHKHVGIWSEYRAAMDTFRPEWRTYQSTMKKGVYTKIAIASPNVEHNASTGLNGVAATALSGTVRIYNAEDANGARDVLLPATALENFSDKNETLMLWAPSEYAAIADRCITAGAYDKSCINQDTKTFLVTNTTYTFENAAQATSKNVSNQLIMTQPTKRFLAQLGEDTYWQNDATDFCEEAAGAKVVSGTGYGVVANYNIFNDDEKTFGKKAGEPIDDGLTSPGDHEDTDPAKQGNTCRELAVIADIEKGLTDPADGTNWPETSNGFASYTFGAGGMIPAIVSQMTASVVDGEGKINWVYAPTDKPNR